MFTDNTTRVDSEPSNGSNDDITNSYECDQTLNVSAGTTNLSADPINPQTPTTNHSPVAYYVCFLSLSKTTKSYKDALNKSCLDDAIKSSMRFCNTGDMKLVPRPDQVMIFNLEDGRYLLQTLGQEELEFLMKKVGMQSMSPEMMKKYGGTKLKSFGIFGSFTSSLLNAACKKAVNLLKKGLLIRREAVPDELKDNSEYKTEAVVTEKQAGNVQTNLTMSSAKLEIQSMWSFPLIMSDLAVQRTPLIDPVISMVDLKGCDKEQRVHSGY
ncbi:hypothetical protein Tco_0881845 [Tanacetum coccineum]